MFEDKHGKVSQAGAAGNAAVQAPLIERVRLRYETAVVGFQTAAKEYCSNVDREQLNRLTRLKQDLIENHVATSQMLREEEEHVENHRLLLARHSQCTGGANKIGSRDVAEDVGNTVMASTAAASEEESEAIKAAVEESNSQMVDAPFSDPFHCADDVNLDASVERMKQRRENLLSVGIRMRSMFEEREFLLQNCAAQLRKSEDARREHISQSMETLLQKLSAIAYTSVSESQVLVHRAIHSINEQLVDNASSTAMLLSKLRQVELVRFQEYCARLSVVYDATLILMAESTTLWAAQLLRTPAFRQPSSRQFAVEAVSNVLSSTRAEVTDALHGLQALQGTLEVARPPTDEVYAQTCGGSGENGWLRSYDGDVFRPVFSATPMKVAEEWQATLSVLVRNAQFKLKLLVEKTRVEEEALKDAATRISTDAISILEWVRSPLPGCVLDAHDSVCSEVEAWQTISLDPTHIEEVFVPFTAAQDFQHVVLKQEDGSAWESKHQKSPRSGCLSERGVRWKALQQKCSLRLTYCRAVIEAECAWFAESMASAAHAQLVSLQRTVFSACGCIRFIVEDCTRALQLCAEEALGHVRGAFVLMQEARKDHNDKIQWLENDVSEATKRLEAASNAKTATNECAKGMQLLENIQNAHASFHAKTIQSMKRLVGTATENAKKTVKAMLKQVGVEEADVVLDRFYEEDYARALSYAAAASSDDPADAASGKVAKGHSRSEGTNNNNNNNNGSINGTERRKSNSTTPSRGSPQNERPRGFENAASDSEGDSPTLTPPPRRSLSDFTTFVARHNGQVMCIVGALVFGQRTNDLYPSSMATLDLPPPQPLLRSDALVEPRASADQSTVYQPSYSKAEESTRTASAAVGGISTQDPRSPTTNPLGTASFEDADEGRSENDVQSYALSKALEILLSTPASVPGAVEGGGGGGRQLSSASSSTPANPKAAKNAKETGGNRGKKTRVGEGTVAAGSTPVERYRKDAQARLTIVLSSFIEQQQQNLRLVFRTNATIPQEDIVMWQDDLRSSVSNWVLDLQQRVVDNVNAYLVSQKAELDERTNEIMRHHRRRAPAFQAQVYEARMRRLEDNAAAVERQLEWINTYAEKLTATWEAYQDEELTGHSSDWPSPTGVGAFKDSKLASKTISPGSRQAASLRSGSRDAIEEVVNAMNGASSLSALDANAHQFRNALANLEERYAKRKALLKSDLNEHVCACDRECERFTQQRMPAFLANGTISAQDAGEVKARVDTIRTSVRGLADDILRNKLPTKTAMEEERLNHWRAKCDTAFQKNRDELQLLANMQRTVTQLRTNVHGLLSESGRDEDAIEEFITALEKMASSEKHKFHEVPRVKSGDFVTPVAHMRQLHFESTGESLSSTWEHLRGESEDAMKAAELERLAGVHRAVTRAAVHTIRASTAAKLLSTLDQLRLRLYRRGYFLGCLSHSVDILVLAEEEMIEPTRLPAAEHAEAITTFVGIHNRAFKSKKRVGNARQGERTNSGVTGSPAVAALFAAATKSNKGVSALRRAVSLGVRRDTFGNAVVCSSMDSANSKMAQWSTNAKEQLVQIVNEFLGTYPNGPVRTVRGSTTSSFSSAPQPEASRGNGANSEDGEGAAEQRVDVSAIIAPYVSQCGTHAGRLATHVQESLVTYRTQVQRLRIILDSMPSLLYVSMQAAELNVLASRIASVWDSFEAYYLAQAKARKENKQRLKVSLGNGDNASLLQNLEMCEARRSSECELRIKLCWGAILQEVQCEAEDVVVRAATMTESFFALLRGVVSPDHLTEGTETTVGAHRGLKRLLLLRAQHQAAAAALQARSLDVDGKGHQQQLPPLAGAAARQPQSHGGGSHSNAKQKHASRSGSNPSPASRDRGASNRSGSTSSGFTASSTAPATEIDESHDPVLLPIAYPQREYDGLALHALQPLVAFRRNFSPYVPQYAEQYDLVPTLCAELLHNAADSESVSAAPPIQTSGSGRSGATGAVGGKERVGASQRQSNRVGGAAAPAPLALASEGALSAETMMLLTKSPPLTAPSTRVHELSITLQNSAVEDVQKMLHATMSVVNQTFSTLLDAEIQWRVKWSEAMSFLHSEVQQ